MGAALEDGDQVDGVHDEHDPRQKHPPARRSIPPLQELGDGLGVIGLGHGPDPGRHDPGEAGEGDVHQGGPDHPGEAGDEAVPAAAEKRGRAEVGGGEGDPDHGGVHYVPIGDDEPREGPLPKLYGEGDDDRNVGDEEDLVNHRISSESQRR